MSTIVALSTAPGRSAIAVIRLSGPHALSITSRLVETHPFDPQPSCVALYRIVDPNTGDIIDQALITYFQAPNSFTGEDVVEISCHGSPLVVRRIIDLALEGEARLAGAGEFTLRALANGKLNLSQAEAVRDLINAQTESALRQAVRQLRGELSDRLQPLKDQLIRIIVQLESAVEFVEDDLPRLQSDALGKTLFMVGEDISDLASTFESGHWLRDGVKAPIIGRPNVGKSSVFNRLLRFERAIVTSTPGTTRDTLSETINLGGVPVSLIDTAGIRDAADGIESIGIERTRKAIADADLVLVVLDGSAELADQDREVLAEVRNARHLVVVNKCDLPRADPGRLKENGDGHVHISALTGEGVEELCAAILNRIGTGASDCEGLVITDARHHDLLRRSRSEIDTAIRSLKEGASEELTLVSLHNALKFVGAITGETTTEEILSEIFATFCIGK